MKLSRLSPIKNTEKRVKLLTADLYPNNIAKTGTNRLPSAVPSIEGISMMLCAMCSGLTGRDWYASGMSSPPDSRCSEFGLVPRRIAMSQNARATSPGCRALHTPIPSLMSVALFWNGLI